jgi:hypothetical protein
MGATLEVEMVETCRLLDRGGESMDVQGSSHCELVWLRRAAISRRFCRRASVIASAESQLLCFTGLGGSPGECNTVADVEGRVFAVLEDRRIVEVGEVGEASCFAGI